LANISVEVLLGGQLTPDEESLYRKLFKKKFGYDPVHAHIYDNPWIISTWKSDEVTELVELQHKGEELYQKNPKFADSKQFDFLNKLWQELKSTTRNTVIRPASNPIIKLNVLTLAGMTEMGKRSTAESSSTNSHMNIGTGTTPEQETDSTTYSNSLQTQLARIAVGSRATVNQQERYSAAFSNPTHVTGSPNISEAGINTHASSGIQIARVTFPAESLPNGYTKAFQALINHRNGVAA
jgi:hypothetical protein